MKRPLKTMTSTSLSILFCAFIVSACTSEKSSDTSEISGGTGLKATSTATCNQDELASFDRSEGEAVDLDQEVLPQGLYLATVSEMLVDAKTETQPARFLVREVIGGGGAEVVCAENMERLTSNFETSLSGLMKFNTKEKPEGSDFSFRQYYFFKNKTDYGVVVSNPQNVLAASEGLDLKRIMKHPSNNAQMYRLSNGGYVLKYSRESEGINARLRVRLELIH